MEIELTVQLDPAFRRKVDRERLNRIILQTLRLEGIAESLSMGLLVTDDDRIKTLNLRYRGQDEATDVLAFGAGNEQHRFVSPLSAPTHLGDVVVSYPRAVSQADALGPSIEEELDRLVVHGVLHLLGYDDQGDQERQIMWDRQESILLESQADL